jgi:hypothetical protein
MRCYDQREKTTWHLYSCPLTLPDRMSHIRHFGLCFVNAALSVSKRHADLAKMLRVIRSQWKPATQQRGKHCMFLHRASVGSSRYDADITTPFTAISNHHSSVLVFRRSVALPTCNVSLHFALTYVTPYYEDYYYFPRCNIVILTFRRNALIRSLGEKSNTQAVS